MDMADDFAEAFRRYWLIIVTVALFVGTAMLYAGGIYVSLLGDVADLKADVRVLELRMERVEPRLP